MHPREKIARAEGFPRIESQYLRGVGAALRQAGTGIPYEGRDRTRGERLLHARFALRERRLVLPTFGEQRGKNIGAQRDGHDAGARGKHAVRHRQAGRAEMTDPDGGRADDCQRDDKGRSRRKYRLATRRDPQQHRKQQRNRHDCRPRLLRQRNHDDTHDDEQGQRDKTFNGFAACRRLARR